MAALIRAPVPSSLLLLVLLSVSNAFLSPTMTPGFQSSRLQLPSPRARAKFVGGSLGLKAKTYTTKDFGVDWNRPDAQGNFGKVWFASQGFAGMGGQVRTSFFAGGTLSRTHGS